MDSPPTESIDAPAYLIARDHDLSRLEAEVNARLEEGYSLAGQLFAVTPAEGAFLYLQPLVLELDKEEEG